MRHIEIALNRRTTNNIDTKSIDTDTKATRAHCKITGDQNEIVVFQLSLERSKSKMNFRVITFSRTQTQQRHKHGTTLNRWDFVKMRFLLCSIRRSYCFVSLNVVVFEMATNKIWLNQTHQKPYFHREIRQSKLNSSNFHEYSNFALQKKNVFFPNWIQKCNLILLLKTVYSLQNGQSRIRSIQKWWTIELFRVFGSTFESPWWASNTAKTWI